MEGVEKEEREVMTDGLVHHQPKQEGHPFVCVCVYVCVLIETDTL